MGSPDWVTKRDPINTQERGNVSSMPKPRPGLVQPLLSHPLPNLSSTSSGHSPAGQPLQGDQAHQIPQVHPAEGKRAWKYSHFCRGKSFLLAQQSHCTSAAANPASGWSGCVLPSLQLHQGFQCLQEDPVDRLLLVAQMDLWVLVGLVDPERKGRRISAGFLRAMPVREKKNKEGSPLPSAQRRLSPPSPQVVQAGPVKVQKVNFSCEHLSSHHPKPSLDAANLPASPRGRGGRGNLGVLRHLSDQRGLAVLEARALHQLPAKKGSEQPRTDTNPIPPPSARQESCQCFPGGFFWGGQKGISANTYSWARLANWTLGTCGAWGTLSQKKRNVRDRSRVTNSPGRGEFLLHNLH